AGRRRLRRAGPAAAGQGWLSRPAWKGRTVSCATPSGHASLGAATTTGSVSSGMITCKELAITGWPHAWAGNTPGEDWSTVAEALAPGARVTVATGTSSRAAGAPTGWPAALRRATPGYPVIVQGCAPVFVTTIRRCWWPA